MPQVPLQIQAREQVALKVQARQEQGKGPVGHMRRLQGQVARGDLWPQSAR